MNDFNLNDFKSLDTQEQFLLATIRKLQLDAIKGVIDIVDNYAPCIMGATEELLDYVDNNFVVPNDYIEWFMENEEEQGNIKHSGTDRIEINFYRMAGSPQVH